MLTAVSSMYALGQTSLEVYPNAFGITADATNPCTQKERFLVKSLLTKLYFDIASILTKAPVQLSPEVSNFAVSQSGRMSGQWRLPYTWVALRLAFVSANDPLTVFGWAALNRTFALCHVVTAKLATTG